MTTVEVFIYEARDRIKVDAEIDTRGVWFAPRLTREEKRDIANECEVHLYHPRSGKRLKKLERRVDLEDVRRQIFESNEV